MTSFSERVEYQVIVHAEDGSFWAEVQELPGCFATGDTEEELEANLIEAMVLYLSSDNVKVQITPVSMDQDDDVSVKKLVVC
jgi:predicted RNase H-like HicB family nuclease